MLRALRLAPALALVVSLAACDTVYEDDGNDIRVRTFSFSGSDLEITDGGRVASYQRELAELTREVVDDGAVLVYADGELLLENGAGTWTPLPVTVGVDANDDLVVDYTIAYTYSFDLNDLYIDLIGSPTDIAWDALPRTDVRVVMLPGYATARAAARGVDLRSYEAVAEAFDLQAD